jgi:hypothetical protein
MSRRATVAGLQAAANAYITYATGEYRPILIHGLWSGAIALLALHGVGLATRGWKGKVLGAVGAVLVTSIMAELIERLAAYSN